MTEENTPSTPKWFLTSFAVWMAILTTAPNVLDAFGMTLADPPVQKVVRVISALFTVASVFWLSAGEKKTLLPPKVTDPANPIGKLPMILLCLACLGLMVGCTTPRQRYTVDAPLVSGIYLGVQIAHDAGKLPSPAYEKANEKALAAVGKVNEAYDWIEANPQLADVPGAPCPPLDELRQMIPGIRRYIVGLPPLSPPPRPTTAPATQR